jgi:hypothetical protein
VTVQNCRDGNNKNKRASDFSHRKYLIPHRLSSKSFGRFFIKWLPKTQVAAIKQNFSNVRTVSWPLDASIALTSVGLLVLLWIIRSCTKAVKPIAVFYQQSSDTVVFAGRKCWPSYARWRKMAVKCQRKLDDRTVEMEVKWSVSLFIVLQWIIGATSPLVVASNGLLLVFFDNLKCAPTDQLYS